MCVYKGNNRRNNQVESPRVDFFERNERKKGGRTTHVSVEKVRPRRYYLLSLACKHYTRLYESLQVESVNKALFTDNV